MSTTNMARRSNCVTFQSIDQRLPACVYHCILKLPHRIADLVRSEEIQSVHLADVSVGWDLWQDDALFFEETHQCIMPFDFPKFPLENFLKSAMIVRD